MLRRKLAKRFLMRTTAAKLRIQEQSQENRLSKSSAQIREIAQKMYEKNKLKRTFSTSNLLILSSLIY